MRFYTLLAAAKINLYLEIIGDRSDGFHELVMVMQSVDLADRVTVRGIGSEEIRLRCDHPQVPTDETNLAYRAAALLVQQFPDIMGRRGGVEITIEKQIPVGAGLAGGSGNAAAVLVGLDLLWQLGLTQGELQTLGAQLGSDIPFSVVGGTAIATGRGETITPIPGAATLHAVLAKYRSLSVSTPWAYKTYRQQFQDTYLNPSDPDQLADRHQRVHAGGIVSAIAKQDSTTLGTALHNDLEKVVLPAHPQVAALRQIMAAAGGLGTLMSGSGPTVFTLAASQSEAELLCDRIREQIPDPDLDLWVTRFSSTGIRLDA
jgi:4-diphosphocytidyl-2-C-methyl-D-erythritol kinase